MNSVHLARGAMWNLLGQVLPVIAAVLCIPSLVARLGPERFGVLTLAWALVGYFTLFDLGIGPAVTRALARFHAEGRTDETPRWFWTAILLTLGLGVVGGFVICAAAPWLAGGLLHVPPELRDETRGILVWLGVSLPFVTAGSAAAGALAAHHRFGALNAVRAPLGVLLFVAPLVVARFDPHLPAMGATLLVTRLAGSLLYLALCVRFLPLRTGQVAVHGPAARGLLTFGGWMSVSAVLGPVMVYFDRFLIGALLTLAMVAYYTTPYDLVTRLWIVSQAIVGVLYPALTAAFARDPQRATRLFEWGTLVIAAIVFPVTFAFVLYAPEGLTLWLGATFAGHSAPVLRWIAAGVFVNAIAQVALAVVQVSGRPRWSATLHVLELPCYLAALWFLVRSQGIAGAALAWFLRVLVDAIVLFVLAARVVEGGRRVALLGGAMALGTLTLMALGTAIAPLGPRIAFGAAVLGVAGWLAYVRILVPGRAVLTALLATRFAGEA